MPGLKGTERSRRSLAAMAEASAFLAKGYKLLLWGPGCITARTATAEGDSSSSRRLISVGQSITGVLMMDISDYCDVIDEQFLAEATRDCKGVCLSMTNVHQDMLAPLIPLISKYISPKLLELTIRDCPTLTWTGHVKKILEAASGVEALNFQKNPWCDDFVVDQVTAKFAKSLRSINLENCRKVSDNGLYHVGKRCHGVRSLTLNCCPKVTDSGLQELAKRVHLSSINLCHNVQITDDGLERLIAASGQLTTVGLTNCPKLTDASMEALYEAVTAWGKRRNVKTLTVKELELRDNPLMTFQALVFISTAVPNLTKLDLRDCGNIDVTKGMLEMERMRYLEELYLGPCSYQPLDSDAFLQSMLFHAANLRVLHLVGIGDMGDDDFSELMSATLVLEDLAVEGMELGVHTIEAVCSNVPNLKKFSLIGSSFISDPDVRCLTSICLFLSDLTLVGCSQIGDPAFSRCVSLKRLKNLRLGRCHPQRLTGQFLAYLTTCPLETLSLQACCFTAAAPLSKFVKLMSITSIFSVHTLRLKDFVASASVSTKGSSSSSSSVGGLSVEDVQCVLSYFTNCRVLDLGGSLTDAAMRAMPALQHSHPFMTYSPAGVDPEFVGFAESTLANAKHTRFANTQTLTRRYFAARLIQRLRRGFVKWRNDIREQQRIEKERHRLRCIVKIQSVARMRMAWIRVKPRLMAGRRIVRGARRFLAFRFNRKYGLAKAHYAKHLKALLFRKLVLASSASREMLTHRADKVGPRIGFRTRRRIYRWFRDEEDNFREEKLYVKSLVLWEGHLLRRMIKQWKMIRGETLAKRNKLAKLFIIVSDVGRQNSHRQLLNTRMADNFRNFAYLVQGWICFADDFIRSRKADLLVPKAVSHFNYTFVQRVVRFCFRGVIYYVETKRIKARSIAQAEVGRKEWLRFNGLRHAFWEAVRVKRNKRNKRMAFEFYFTYNTSLALQNRLPINVLYERHRRESLDKARFQWNDYKVDFYFNNMMYNVLLLKRIREMNWQAEQMRNRIYNTQYFGLWVYFKKMNASFGDNLFKKYCLKIAVKCIAALKLEAAEGRAYKTELQQRMVAQAKATARADEDAAAAHARMMAALIKGITKMQARARGFFQRKKYAAYQTKVLFATQTLQNFARKGLAILLCKKKRRLRSVTFFKLEERELNAMREEDARSLWYEIHARAVLLIQRMYRGWRGRLRFVKFKKKTIAQRSKDYYRANLDLRLNLEAAREELARRERKRGASATLIQKRARGMIARKRFIRIKMQAKLVKCTILVQKVYRKRLAMLKLEALRRKKFIELRYRFARAQRGFLLRLIGFQRRKNQRVLAPALLALGLDPITFNYRLNELLEETITDLTEMIKVVRREIGLFRKWGFDKKARDTEKKAVLAEDGVGLEVRDACKIISSDHKFMGETGVIARIDQSLPGIPLYEIKLDGFGGRLTFSHMTRDPLVTYMDPQPLNEINRWPKLEGFKQPYVLYGVNEGDPMFTRRNIGAAWTIQRAFRCHRSRKIAARKRFEYWLRSADRQWSFFTHLADTNTLTMQSNYFLTWLGVKPEHPVFFDEVRHPLFTGRYESAIKVKNEKKSIQNEFEQKYRERLLFIQKQALFKGKDFFRTGYEKLTTNKKVSMYLNNKLGFKSKGGSAAGSKSLKASKKGGMVEGIAQYDFEQFHRSPHVRYDKTYFYQGSWSGIPLVTPLRPHGEGMLVFFDGWGFAREDKVLYLDIICARYLNAADLDTSDPFCDINCNATNLQTSVKWENLNPVWNESFEIDVTNPLAELNIAIYDKDYIGDNDFLGQITIQLKDYADGKEHRKVFLLKGEDESVDEDFDRGEIEVKMRWTNRKFEDDLARELLQKKKATRIQAWARRIASISTRRRILKERQTLLDMVKRRAVQITNTCRIRIAKKVVMKLRRRLTACIKIQCRARIRQAKLKVGYGLRRRRAAVKIQTLMRKCLAKARVRRMKKDAKAALSVKAAVIQKFARRKLAYLAVKAMRLLERQRLLALQAEDDEGDFAADEEKPPVSSWLPYYGVDPEYGLKRNRRMTKAYFDRILVMQYCRVVTKYGVLYVDQYPPEKSAEDAELERKGQLPLSKREDFLGVFFPPFNPSVTHRNQAVEILEKSTFTAFIHIPTAVQFRKTVDFIVMSIQCAARQRIARKKRAQLERLYAAFTKLQRRFRKRSERKQLAATRIQALFHLIHAKVVAGVVRIERKSAMHIQMGYRCYLARAKLFDLRCVTEVSVLKYSSAVPFHGPAKLLDFKARSFWMTESPELAEVRFEMKRKECINQIWIMTSTHSSQPKTVEISTVVDKASKQYRILVERTGMLFLRGSQWQKFPIEETTSKYFKFSFTGNYGDDDHISVRQIRFVRTAEKSATIVVQPPHMIKDDGPTVGKKRRVILKIEAEGFPHPQFQWYKNGVLIPGATSPELPLSFKCRLAKTRRAFRCLKCKMVAHQVPTNAYHVICGNCNALFNYKDIHEYENVIKDLQAEELKHREVLALHMEAFESLQSQVRIKKGATEEEVAKATKARQLLANVERDVKEVETAIQANLEARYSSKQDLASTNRFTDEGVYCCYVSNVRGGSVPILRKSARAVVVIQHSIPYRANVKPTYVPRAQAPRKKWTTYHSMLGTFKKGTLEGIVRLRYADGSFYEGPYIPEQWLDADGHLNTEGRPKDHYGIFKCADGRVFEGVNVDNHFDPNNLQTFYRTTMPNGEVYEGMFCDEMYHGMGMYKYLDGSVYEGKWFKGTQFGHGHFRSIEGWAYEGYFDTNRRQGDGIISYPDGSMYLGRWSYGKRQGPGIYISSLRDIYRGEVVDGIFHGNGEMLYSDGSRYTGEFKGGKRNGIGIFCDSDGTQYYGNFVDDLRHGEHIIKAMIPIEVEGQSNMEIRVGVFDHGQFVKWKIKYSNPVVTQQFIALFKADRGHFDSVYSMVLARNLPNVPDGVDAADEEVQKILKRLRQEAGGLVGQEALLAAQAKLDALLTPLKARREEIERLKEELDQLAALKIDNEQDAKRFMGRFSVTINMAEKEHGRTEQFWMDEPTLSRYHFEQACKGLSETDPRDFFAFRNHRIPPPFTKKILDAVAYLMGEKTDWKNEQMLLADSVTLAREGDDLGLRFDFECKLVFMMKDYKVYQYARIKDETVPLLDLIMADPRMRPDSYYVEAAGDAGPAIVTWIRATYRYVNKARGILPALAAVDDRRAQAFRFRTQSNKKLEEAAVVANNMQVLKDKLAKVEAEALDLSESLARTADMLKFLGANSLFGGDEVKLDYYQELEKKIEERRDHFVVETCVQFCVDKVESLLDFERKAKIRDALARGEVYVEEEIEQGLSIRKWLQEEVTLRQSKVIESGRTLGYFINGDDEPSPLTWAETQEIINRVVFTVTAKMNDKYNDYADASRWCTLKGRMFSMRFLYVLAWKMWEHDGEEAMELKAVTAWEEVFVTPEECAKMAIEAKVNARMAEKAREQGRIWAKRHRMEVEKAEALLAEQFAFEFPDETARQALELNEDESPAIPPATRACSISWARTHPEEMNAARDEKNQELGDLFGKQYNDAAAELAFRIFNGLATEEELVWYDFAQHWRTFHQTEYQAAAQKVTETMAQEHQEAFPDSPAVDAARIIEGDAIGHMMRDEEAKAEHVFDPIVYFNAKSWGLLNQGLLRGATKKLRGQHATTAVKLWIDLEGQTDSFRKGSYLLTSPDIRDSSTLDRFFGFRAKLENKFAWLFGYLTKMHFELYDEMEHLDKRDPYGKVVYNVRPTTLERHLQQQDRAFLAHKRQVETHLGDVISKLSVWNSYFGQRKNKSAEEEEVSKPPVAAGEAAT